MTLDSKPTETQRDAAMLLGRALMSALFIWSGFGKLVAPAATKAYFVHLGVPAPDAAYIVTLLVELGVGIALLLGFKTRLAAAVLGLWCVATAITGHSNFADPANQINFMKNIAMAGGLVFIALFGGGAFAIDRMGTLPK